MFYWMRIENSSRIQTAGTWFIVMKSACRTCPLLTILTLNVIMFILIHYLKFVGSLSAKLYSSRNSLASLINVTPSTSSNSWLFSKLCNLFIAPTPKHCPKLLVGCESKQYRNVSSNVLLGVTARQNFAKITTESHLLTVNILTNWTWQYTCGRFIYLLLCLSEFAKLTKQVKVFPHNWCIFSFFIVSLSRPRCLFAWDFRNLWFNSLTLLLSYRLKVKF